MEPRAPPEYILEVFADQTLVKDIVKGQYSTKGSSLQRSSYERLLSPDPDLTSILRSPSYDFFPSLLPLNPTISP